jgi:hypothetical protein
VIRYADVGGVFIFIFIFVFFIRDDASDPERQQRRTSLLRRRRTPPPIDASGARGRIRRS